MNCNARITSLDEFSTSVNPLRAITFTTATTLLFLAILLTVHGSATRGAAAATIMVDDDGGADYEKIQDAINASEDGDTILIYEGSYFENIVVNRTLGLIGNGTGQTIIKGNWDMDFALISGNGVYCYGISFMKDVYHANHSALRIISDDVAIVNCSASNSSSGIFLDGTDNTTISGTVCNSNIYGILLNDSHRCLIENNTSSENIGPYCSGIRLEYSSNNTITNNTFRGNKVGVNGRGVYLKNSDHNTIARNNCSYNDQAGILLGIGSNFNTVSQNILMETKWHGIYICGENNTITSNIHINDGIYFGTTDADVFASSSIDSTNTVNGKPVLFLQNLDGGMVEPGAGQIIMANCSNMIVEGQDIRDTDYGIYLCYCSGIVVRENTLHDNRRGIYVSQSDDIIVENNSLLRNSDSIILGSSNCTVSGNHVERGGNGIWILGHRNSIINNTVDGCSKICIILGYRSSYNSVILNNCSQLYGHSRKVKISSQAHDNFIDTDGDNVADEEDAFPEDPLRWVGEGGDDEGDDEERFVDRMVLYYLLTALLFLYVALVVVVMKR